MPDINRTHFRPSRPAGYAGNGEDQEPGGSPLRSPEALEQYCSLVQRRLAEHAARRRQFLQEAYDRLSRLMQSAHAVDDANLYHELWQHCLVARELLEALSRNDSSALRSSCDVPTDSPLFLNAESPSAPLLTDSAVVNATARPLALPRRETPAPAYAAYQPVEAVPSAPRVPRRAMRPISDIEVDAGLLRAEVAEFAAKYSLRNESGEFNVVNGLRLRALACKHRRLEAEAGDSEAPEVTELGRDILTLMTEGDDHFYTIARDMEIDPKPTAYQWGELAERYQEMTTAQAAFTWWRRHENDVPVSEIQPLAEAVAAIQQRFNRLLFRLGARDPFQQQLFDDLRAWAKEAQCYLHSLRPKVPIAELVDRAATLDPEWARLCMDHPFPGEG